YYMSPEQWGEIPRDGSSEIDGRADIYSLGLVFYEMIAGRRCFAGNTLHELRAGLATPSGSTTSATAQQAVLPETVVGDKRETNADVNAPTVLTLDAA